MYGWYLVSRSGYLARRGNADSTVVRSVFACSVLSYIEVLLVLVVRPTLITVTV